MPRREWVVIAASSLTWLLVGCNPQTYLGSWAVMANIGSEEFVGTPEMVSLRVETSLKALGLNVEASKDGEAIRLDSITSSGKKFHLLLTNSGEKTKLRIVWDNGSDDRLWVDLLATLRPTKPEPTAPTEHRPQDPPYSPLHNTNDGLPYAPK
jgi:hypothetical protein